MLHIVLYQPEIPPNAGNIMRLCANTGFYLHLIEPLGFNMEDKRLRRAGLDYHEWAEVNIHKNLADFFANTQVNQTYALTTKGAQSYHRVNYAINDALIFGPESRGLPEDWLRSLKPEQRLRLPMRPQSRSLNLSNAAAILVYEAWRQLDFIDAQMAGRLGPKPTSENS